MSSLSSERASITARPPTWSSRWPGRSGTSAAPSPAGRSAATWTSRSASSWSQQPLGGLFAAGEPLHWLLVATIPLIDTKAQYTPLLTEIRARIDEVLESGAFILGPNVKAFEQESAAYLGVADSIGVANGTDAISLVLDALEIGPGDEVICPAFTFYATAEPIARAGATPVFAEIDPVTLNVDPEDVAAKIGPRTKAIMPVHLFGRPAPLDGLRDA